MASRSLSSRQATRHGNTAMNSRFPGLTPPLPNSIRAATQGQTTGPETKMIFAFPRRARPVGHPAARAPALAEPVSNETGPESLPACGNAGADPSALVHAALLVVQRLPTDNAGIRTTC